mgnify:CR=1 FL=1
MKLTKDMKLKSGAVVPVGAPCAVIWIRDNPTICRVLYPDGPIDGVRVRVAALPGFFSDDFEMPPDDQIEEWVYDSVCETPTGQRVEPDGYGQDGSPSWLLALGLM